MEGHKITLVQIVLTLTGLLAFSQAHAAPAFKNPCGLEQKDIAFSGVFQPAQLAAPVRFEVAGKKACMSNRTQGVIASCQVLGFEKSTKDPATTLKLKCFSAQIPGLSSPAALILDQSPQLQFGAWVSGYVNYTLDASKNTLFQPQKLARSPISALAPGDRLQTSQAAALKRGSR